MVVVVTWAVVVVVVVASWAVRLRHPELTETQLFLAYWWPWEVGVALAAVLLVIVSRRK